MRIFNLDLQIILKALKIFSINKNFNCLYFHLIFDLRFINSVVFRKEYTNIQFIYLYYTINVSINLVISTYI